MDFTKEFPDFPAADMPAMPATFADTSWHNNSMPSITSDQLGLHIWIDYVDRAKREFTDDGPRFLVEEQDHGIEIGKTLLETDDWADVLSLIASRRDAQVTAIAEAFAEVIRQWLSPAELELVGQRNAQYDEKVCATHDFCDANMAMEAAFHSVLDRELVSEDENMEQAKADIALWNDAWALAKRLYFTA